MTFAVALQARAQEAPRYAGPTDKGFLLPNGWTLKPAGQHIPLTDLPLNIIPLADNRHVLVATSGYNAHELSLIDLEQKKVIDRQAVRQSWFGLAVSPERRPDLVVGGRGKHGACVSPRGWPSDRRQASPNPRPRPAATIRRQRDRTSAAAWRSTRIARCSTRWTSTAARSRPST